MTIPYVLDGEAREYTPDVIVHLDDGRAFIIEAKPLVGLGDFMNRMEVGEPGSLVRAVR